MPAEGIGMAAHSASDTVVVVTGGDPVALEHLATVPAGALVIAADSGIGHAHALGLTVDVALGDFDSVEEIGAEHLPALAPEVLGRERPFRRASRDDERDERVRQVPRAGAECGQAVEQHLGHRRIERIETIPRDDVLLVLPGLNGELHTQSEQVGVCDAHL
jgi:hypothetical protein